MCDAYSAVMAEIKSVSIPSGSETRELGKRVKDGDQDAVAELVRRNMPLVLTVAKGLVKRRGDMLELVQVGAIALWDAARRYDYERGEFSTLAWTIIQRRMWHAIRMRRKSEFATLPEGLSCVCHGAVEDADRMHAAIEQLPARERYVVCRRYGLDGDKRVSPLSELASELGISTQRVSQVQFHALAELREVLSAAFTVEK